MTRGWSRRLGTSLALTIRSWTPAVVADASSHCCFEPDRPRPPESIATLEPKQCDSAANGAYIFDMGQNMVGWATLKVKGAAGTKVRMRFAEILNPDGTHLHRKSSQCRCHRHLHSCAAAAKRVLLHISLFTVFDMWK